MTLLPRIAIEHSARSAIAAGVSLAVAKQVGLPEAYWAAITTMIVMQSSVGAALAVSGQRVIGAALGASMGAILANHLRPELFTFTAGIFVLGIVSALLGSLHPRLRKAFDYSTYRFAGVSLAVVFLIARPENPWMVALHRFTEISIGIVIALLLTRIWPEPDPKLLKP